MVGLEVLKSKEIVAATRAGPIQTFGCESLARAILPETRVGDSAARAFFFEIGEGIPTARSDFRSTSLPGQKGDDGAEGLKINYFEILTERMKNELGSITKCCSRVLAVTNKGRTINPQLNEKAWDSMAMQIKSLS